MKLGTTMFGMFDRGCLPLCVVSGQAAPRHYRSTVGLKGRQDGDEVGGIDRALPFPFHDGRAAGELPVRDLNFDLKRLQRDHDDGSHGSRAASSYALAQMANALHELGYRGLHADGLKPKHVEALVRSAWH